ncbi:MAG: hypothetical protein ABSF70_08130 [Terracidiphilus sp.]|jgi:hypothetical protein
MTTAAGRSCSLFPAPCQSVPPHPPLNYLFSADFLADNYVAGKENEAAKVNNTRVIIEQNSVSSKIVNVRENARFVPLREKWLVNHVRISSEKRRFPSEKWAF